MKLEFYISMLFHLVVVPFFKSETIKFDVFGANNKVIEAVVVIITLYIFTKQFGKLKIQVNVGVWHEYKTLHKYKYYRYL